ncbi:hypothetical protein EDB87DRAFT_891820 [Lactarius vividus]|nr:hypothetical protein EDB87DRAFT_891820 [Lactarius vividus]
MSKEMKTNVCPIVRSCQWGPKLKLKPTVFIPRSSPSRDTYSSAQQRNTRMRPPTRSTRSVRQRQPSKRVGPNARGSPHTPGLPASFLVLEPSPQPIGCISGGDIEVATSSGSDAMSALVSGCTPSELWPPTTFVYENQGLVSESANAQDPSATAGVTPPGKLPRSRHRMTGDKLETLEAFFRRNTHPSRKEKEDICKDLGHVSRVEQPPHPVRLNGALIILSAFCVFFFFRSDLKTVTIWFQNKRQTVARSRKQSESFSSENLRVVPTAAIDMLASASATMTPLAAAEVPSVSTVMRLDSDPSGGSCAQCSSFGNPPTSRFLHASSSCAAYPSAPDSQPRTPLSTAQDPNVFESALPPRDMYASSTRMSSPSSSPGGSELRKPRNHDWPIDPENLWKYIPSSPLQQQPVQSSPDVSPDVGGSGSTGLSLRRRPRTLEWACARSAKRRRAYPDSVHSEDGETDAGRNAEEHAICQSPCCASDVRVPPECHGKYPPDVVRGAVLLLGLRDAGSMI